MYTIVAVHIGDTDVPRIVVALVPSDRFEEVTGAIVEQILIVAQYVTQIHIAYIEVAVVAVDVRNVASRNIIHYVVYVVEEVHVDLVDVFDLSIGQTQLVGHAVGQIPCIVAYVVKRGRNRSRGDCGCTSGRIRGGIETRIAQKCCRERAE